MSKGKNTQNENETSENVEMNNESTQNETTGTTSASEETIEQATAQRVLRAKLPALNARNFNFEKRTGNVFTASIVKVYDEEGNPVMENGAIKERLVRKVVEIETEDGVLLPEFEDIKADLIAKRAAAYVLSADTVKEKLMAKIEALVLALDEAKNELAVSDVTLANACEIVMSVQLPEKAERVNVTAKLTEATDKLSKMKAMLLAAGLSEEEIDEQLNG